MGNVTPTAAGSGDSVGQGRFKYPNPYFDIASTYVPPSIKTLFRYTKYFYYSNSIISPIIYKLSEYPVTGLVYEKARGEKELSTKTKDIWERMLEENLKIRRTQIEINLDTNVYGNCFLSISYPFVRMLECPSCKKKHNITKVKWKFTRWKFRGNCPSCKAEDMEFNVHDKTIRNRKRVKLVRWNPVNISIDYNSITGVSKYMYQTPNKEKKAIAAGKPGYIDTIPWVFIEAARDGKNVELEPENVFHFKRASISDSDMGWGMPVIMPVIKDAYYLQVLRKAQEAIFVEHILPLRILFPQHNADTSPYVSMDLGSWCKKVEGEIRAWRQDPNRVSIMPVPVGIENMGGDARALMVTNEIKLMQQEIAGGMGVPIELIFGGLSYSGSSVSLRILENHFLTMIQFHNEFLDWLIARLSRFFKLPKVNVKLGSFKMADDIQYKQLMLQMQQAGNISSTTMLGEHDLDFTEQQELIKKEQQTKNAILGITQIQNAEIQGQLGIIGARYNALAQGEGQKIMSSIQNEMAAAQDMPPGSDPNAQPGQGQPAPGGPAGPGQADPAAAGPQPAPSGQAPSPEEDAAMQGPAVSMTIPQMVEQYANQMASMPPEQREEILARMEQQTEGAMPQLAAAIRQRLAQMESAQNEQTKKTMKPLPEQRAPRRENSPV